jgi:DNA replication licensing factor MCM5
LQLEDAAKEVADEMTQPRGEGREQVQPVQVMLCSDENEQTIRSLKVRALRGHYGYH